MFNWAFDAPDSFSLNFLWLSFAKCEAASKNCLMYGDPRVPLSFLTKESLILVILLLYVK